MPRVRLAATVVSFSTVVSACESSGQWQMTLDLISDMQRAAILCNVITLNSAISTCEKAGQWQVALDLLHSSNLKISANVITLNAAMSACQKGGQWQLVLELLTAMSTAGLSADVITFSAAISACEPYGFWEQVLLLHAEMARSQVVPNRITYSASISACRAGNWQLALGFFVRMQARGLEADVSEFQGTFVKLVTPHFFIKHVSYWLCILLWHEVLRSLIQRVLSPKYIYIYVYSRKELLL